MEESNCRGYRLPISSPFFKTSYDLGRREIYAVTDIPLARNKAHYLEHFETCETVQVSSIRKEGDDYYMTFILTEEQFECYKINLNEANITYCSRYK